jgi:RNA polymerase sigma factor (sigma-70 family)
MHCILQCMGHHTAHALRLDYGRTGEWVAPDTLTPLLQVAQAEATDGPGLDRFLIAVRRTVVAFLGRRTDAESADDLAQVVLLTVARDYRAVLPECAGSWLVTVTLNVLRDEFRRRAQAADRFVRAGDVAHGLTTAEPMSAATEYAELRTAVTGAAKERCSPAERDTVAGLLDGLTIRDIADLSGTSPRTVRMRLHRARAMLAPVLLPLLR